MRKFILLLLLACLTLSAAERKADLGRETKVDSILASVNGEPVTLLDVLLESGNDEARLAAMFTGERLYSNTENLRRKILEEIIVRKLVYAQYKGNPFEIRKQDIEDMVDALALTMGDGTRESMEKRAKALGTSMNELQDKAKEKIAVDVLLNENCDRRVYITPKEVYESYKANPDAWRKPAKIDLQLLEVRRGGALDPVKVTENLKKMLANADADMFARIVRENSDGPNAARGGKMGWIDVDKLRPEFASALKNAKPGDIAGPVETPEGFYFLRLAERAPAQMLPFEKVAPEINKTLRNRAILDRRRIYTDQLKKEAVIRYYF